MRLGLVTDVHNHHVELAAALELLQNRGVDRIVTLGDTCDAFARIRGAAPVAKLLDDFSVTGVWGNHDFTLCRDVPAEAWEQFSPVVISVMSRMQPRLVLEDCHFSHKESTVDPFDILQLWDFGYQSRKLEEKAVGSFAAVEQRLQFIGHYHKWWAATLDGPLDWQGKETLKFEADKRYFVVIAPVFEGWCALLDTDDGELEPIAFQVEHR